ncbi:MAG: hypothetical protein M1833_001945 [Piccolia ochrophora]|nr:MAG: hypothetical protein M1833_001945 [Piccolia ochrophora]
MELSSLLAQDPVSQADQTGRMASQQQHSHQYSTRHSASYTNQHVAGNGYSTPPTNQADSAAATPTPYNLSPQASPKPKHVAFELLFPESPTYRARLPMRVQIFPHDTTDSIITTVKNFYGLYEGPGGAKGVSFEDQHGNTLIARYENFHNDMVIYVRVVLDLPNASAAYGPSPYLSESPSKPEFGIHNGSPHRMPPPQPAQALTYGQQLSRPGSVVDRKQSLSPRGRRSESAGVTNGASLKRSRSGLKSRASSTHGSQGDLNGDAMNGYSDSDGGHGSVTSSRKSKTEQLVRAEISLDNIVEGGRRKRAKFESSELPLFVPPQVPLTASTSSASPAYRADGQSVQPLFVHPPQRTFSYPQALQSPQSLGQSESPFAPTRQPVTSFSTPTAPQHGHHLRNRMPASYPPTRQAAGATLGAPVSGILPTPDPTVASCISDEDVAIQLMRLGDASNLSHGTRNSASTADDGFSGAADVASSTGATSESDGETDATEHPTLPRTYRQQLESSPIPMPGLIKKRNKTLDEILPSFDSTEPSGDEEVQDNAMHKHLEAPASEQKDGIDDDGPAEAHLPNLDTLGSVLKAKAPKSKPVLNGINKPRSGTSSLNGVKTPKANKPRPVTSGKPSKSKSSTASKPSVPAPIGPQSRKPSSSTAASSSTNLNFQHQLGTDEEDLSSKPRCQRCRKSKKGCDRQRPCQRCKDAGIGVDGCVSEDEGNGRKGRFGRHMGVIIKKGPFDLPELMTAGEGTPSGGDGTALEADKSKKRKR